MKKINKKKILVYGAGAIGRGYLPWVFSPSKFEYSYVEINTFIRNNINQNHSFITNKIIKNNGRYSYQLLTVPVDNCYSLGDEISDINKFDVIMIAVGSRNALSLIDSLKNTKVPIICYENDSLIPIVLKSMINNPNVVFAIPDVITSNTASEKMLKKYPLSIITEDGVCYIDTLVSKIGGNAKYVTKEELEKQWKAKLYLHNTPHCIAAYLGSLVGVKYLHEIMEYKTARKIISGSMHEMQNVLIKKYNLNSKFVTRYAKKELGRFKNKLLFDPISRVAREPFRKLAPNERLLGAAQLCLSVGIYPRYLMLGIMAAFFYDNNNDPDSNIRYLVHSLDITDFLRIVMQLTPEQALHQLLLNQWKENQKILEKIYE